MDAINSEFTISCQLAVDPVFAATRRINCMSKRNEMNARLAELMPKAFWAGFGRRLLETTKERGKKPADLARHLNCTPAHISKMVKTGSVGLPAAAALATYLNVSLDWLVWGNKTRLPVADQGNFPELLAKWLQSAPVEIRELAATYNANEKASKPDA